MVVKPHMRHSFQLIAQIKQLRVDGFTLGEIKNETGLSKTTILHHIKKIPKSDKLKEKIRQISQKTQKRVADSRRGKSVKNYIFKKPKKWDPDFVNLVAHFLFDGRITRTGCIYYSRNEILRNLVISTMRRVTDVSDYKVYETFNGVKRIAYHNVEVAGFIREKADQLLDDILSAPLSHKVSFIKAFFDDEGCVTFTGKKRLVRGYQHSLSYLRIIQSLLLELGIESKVDERFFEIVISRKENLIKFQKLINFTLGVKVNGNRLNSVWKKSLEKREILKMAVGSYLKKNKEVE